MRHSRLALAAVPIILTVTGCVTVAPGASPPASPAPTEAASSLPSPLVTSAPSATPQPPTQSPSATASAEPTASAALSATPVSAAPSADPVPSDSASAPSVPPVAPDSTLVFADSFDSDANGWGVVDVGFGSIEWFDGALAFAAESAQGSLQSTKPVPDGVAWEELGGSADFTPIEGSDTIMGLYCSPGDGTLIGGLVSVDGTWLVVAGTQDSVTVVDQGQVPEGALVVGQTSTVAFQCSGADDALSPMVRLAVGSEILATTEVPTEYASMPTFSTVGLWVEPVTPPMLVGVDEVRVVGRHVPRRETLGPPPTTAP